jgi:predicted transcriptional regulator
VKSKYSQRVIDIVYERGCAKRETIIDELARELGVPREKLDDVVSKTLKRLVKKGLIVKKATGYYCKP